MLKTELYYVVGVSLLSGILVAASNAGTGEIGSVVVQHLYWMARISVEAALFISVRELVGRSIQRLSRPFLVSCIAFVVSLVVFVLMITTVDIALGFPELGIDGSGAGGETKLSELGLEILYLFDNHLALCLLLSLHYLFSDVPSTKVTPPYVLETPGVTQCGLFLSNLKPALKGDIIWAEAQEHYVRVTTTREARMVLLRFSDIVRDLPSHVGIQTHRSHWVAFQAISCFYKDGTNLRLLLGNGITIPVSRSYRNDIEKTLSGKGIPYQAEKPNIGSIG